jgi:hypothetical protein
MIQTITDKPVEEILAQESVYSVAEHGISLHDREMTAKNKLLDVIKLATEEKQEYDKCVDECADLKKDEMALFILKAFKQHDLKSHVHQE